MHNPIIRLITLKNFCNTRHIIVIGNINFDDGFDKINFHVIRAYVKLTLGILHIVLFDKIFH